MSTNNASVWQTAITRTDLGDELEVFVNDTIGRTVIEKGLHGREELDLFKKVFRHIKVRTCLDVGGNVGNHAAFFSRHCERTYSFEPNPSVFRVLKGNLQRNKFDNVTPVNIGLSDISGVIDFYIVDGKFGASSFDPASCVGRTLEVIQAAVEVGDNFVSEHHIEHVDFIKIDVEGLEAQVIRGLAETIRKDLPIISLEWTKQATRDAFAAGDIFDTILADYTGSIALGYRWSKYLCPGIFGRLRRKFMRAVMKDKKTKCLSAFNPVEDYEALLLIPDRHAGLLDRFTLIGS